MDVDTYFAGLSLERRAALSRLRDTIQAAAPNVEQGMNYGVPALIYDGKPLVCFAAFKDHLGFYPLSPEVIRAFADDLASFSAAKGTVRFPADEPLPTGLIRRMVKARLQEVAD